MRLTYTVVFTPGMKGGYIASVPALPGCATYGQTLTEALLMVEEAMAGSVELLQADGDRIPRERGGVHVNLGRSREAFVRKVTVTLQRKVAQVA
jgi:antitoxin HicB